MALIVLPEGFEIDRIGIGYGIETLQRITTPFAIPRDL
jgi:hypothetical protein